MGVVFFLKHSMWRQLRKAIRSYCSNGFKKHLQIKERHPNSVFRLFFSSPSLKVPSWPL